LQKYDYFIALNSNPKLVISTNMILNLDDPMYSADELASIKNWEISVKNRGFMSSIVCTTKYIHDYLKSNDVMSSISVIPQGHSNLKSSNIRRGSTLGRNLNFVYISPTIDIKGDPHEGHNMWDASTLLLDIWPRVTASNARLHLIGRLGQNASLSLSDNRIISYGLVSIKDCSKILPNFDIALYPRIHDNAWLPQKLIEYIGAGLPILAFDLIDTNIVSNLKVGLLVKNSEEFAQVMDEISSGLVSVDELRKNSVRVAPDYSWSSLAVKFESIFQ
jgi:glycosyltransferase involved in cell wall biosynthesis